MTMPSALTVVGLLHGPDQPGLVARVAGWIFEHGGNILHADQHRDMEAGIFFQRVEWVPAGAHPGKGQHVTPEIEQEVQAFHSFAGNLGMSVRVACSVHRPRVAIFVSKQDHCLHDIVLRWKAGDFFCEIPLVISNHLDLQSAAENYGLRYVHIPVDPNAESKAEAAQLQLLREQGIELVVLARYMQVLSAKFLSAFGHPVINIHHSFLPAFAGGRPYHQAHERGVKLIGATAHYVTAILDDGPIIHQEVTRVTHRHDVEDLMRTGRELEKGVLAQAVAWHLENRILVYGRKTVVFD